MTRQCNFDSTLSPSEEKKALNKRLSDRDQSRNALHYAFKYIFLTANADRRAVSFTLAE